MPGRLLILFFVFTTVKLCGQQEKDSVQVLLRQAGEDSAAVHLLYRYGDYFETGNPDSAVYYYKKARELASKIHYERGIAAFASYYISILNSQGKFREALAETEEALKLYTKLNDKKELAIAYNNVANEWHYLSDFATASEYYLMARKLAEETGSLTLLRRTNNNLASVFIQLEEFEKGKKYAETALEIAGKLNDEEAEASSMINIATAWMQLHDYKKALSLYEKILESGIRVNDDFLLLDGWLGIAGARSALLEKNEAQRYYDKVISFSEEKNTPEYKMYAHMGMADLMIRTGSPLSAEHHLAEGMKLAREMGSKLELKDLYLKASQMHEKRGNLAAALDFRKQFETLQDSIMGERSKALVSNLEAKYEFEKKESTIRQLQAESQVQQLLINRKNMWNYILVGGAAALLLLLVLGYRNYRSRQRIQQHRIAELEAEKKLSVTEAVLQGEEQERVRLAKDLHDGLGGMLSGVKFSLNTMKEQLVLQQDDARAFERSLDMLDTSIKEMRRVAHNMMPESLLKFGLDTALRDFCEEINRSGALNVSYQSIGLGSYQPGQSVSIAIYRIAQELLNNTLKHARAGSALVQVARTDNVLSITVEDDGIGFDVSRQDLSTGIGWKNIRSRVDFVGGKVDISSSPGNGTSVLVEIPV